jgi:2-polyprenyl-6-hydroxyphenyl methylase/3-demethylubiquinone-9 3-methyltransferase
MNSNFDAAEVGKFDALAKQWWDKQGPMGPLHAINPLRLSFIERFADIADKTVLDVGCGGGILTEALARAGAHATGLDLAQDALNVASQHAAEHGVAVNYQCGAVEALASSQPESFDLITCMEMLEHVPDPAAIVQACAQLLKPGGQLFMSTINRNPKAFALAIVGAEHVLGLIPKGTHEYAKFIQPAELARWCRDAGLQVGAMQGMSYNPLTRTHALSTDVDVNYLMHCTKAC